MTVEEKYNELLKKHGKQGWWPLQDLVSEKNPFGYHPGNYFYPKTAQQSFEIGVGAILTQNTAWKNVQKALDGLLKINCLTPEKLNKVNEEKLKQAIRPAGYFNQKAKKLKVFTAFFLELQDTPTREELLNLWGIGPETADSILLYAYGNPVFVVDAYTRRIFSAEGLIEGNENYDKIREMFENNLPQDYRVYQEYHALIVEEGKNY